VPLITAVVQWWQTKLMLPATNTQAIAPSDQPKKGEEKEKTQDDMAEMQKQMALMTPIMFGFFAYQFPLGLALYWNIFGIMGMLQQLAINREKIS